MRLTLFFLALWPFATHAQDVTTGPAVSEIEIGVVCDPPSIRSEPAPGTVAGEAFVFVGDQPFIARGHRAPAVLGLSFGVKIDLRDPDGIDDVILTVTHPPMGPDRVTRQTRVNRIGGAPAQRFYTFDHDYELLIGRWVLEAKKDRQVIYSVAFDVVPAGDMPNLIGLCGQEDLTS